MIEAVCWDVGGVFSGRPLDAVGGLATEHGLDPDEVFSAIFGPYHLDGDHTWHRLERGQITLKEAWADVEAAIGAFGVELTLRDFFSQFGNDPADRSVVSDTVRDLHGRGIAQAIITNNVKEFSESENGGWRSIVPMDVMSVVTDSSAVGMRKPDPAIYLHTLAELDVAAERAVFLDDMDANVQAARDLGMHGIVVGGDPAPAMTELVALVDQLS
ncbi:MAG: HAD family phosphatase [Acidimicrobiales bacterium]|jgi:epoxide hydrolase-like predicted phosphatase|nr:HAD family phosphatase [Acidimicrobiales bacterium]